jgi:hypothetical protein
MTMWKIFKKNSPYFLIYLAAIISLAVLLRLMAGKNPSIPIILITGFLIFMVVFGSVFASEQYEEKNHGYSFLAVLPIKTSSIVGAKFLLILLADIILAGFLVFLISFTTVNAEQFTLIRSYFLMMAAICLLLAAIIYIGIFLFSYTKFVLGFLVFTSVLGALPILILRANRDNIDTKIDALLDFLKNINWYQYIPIVLGVYFVLMGIAVQVKKFRGV